MYVVDSVIHLLKNPGLVYCKSFKSLAEPAVFNQPVSCLFSKVWQEDPEILLDNSIRR